MKPGNLNHYATLYCWNGFKLLSSGKGKLPTLLTHVIYCSDIKIKITQLISWKDAQNKKASAWCSSPKKCDSARRLKHPWLCCCNSTTWLYGRILGNRNFSLYNYKAVLVQTTCIYWSLGGRKEKGGERSRTEMVWKRTLGKGTNQGFSPCWWKWALFLFCSCSKLFGILFFSFLDSIKLPWGRTIVTTAN